MKGPRVFERDEQRYLDWIDRHPDGLVLNMLRSKNPNYRVLHSASCPSIKNYTGRAREGGFVERDYIKVCAQDLESLQAWSRANGRPDGSFSGQHRACYPPK